MEWIRVSVMNITAISVVSAIAECAVDDSGNTESLRFLCGAAVASSVVQMLLQAVEGLLQF